MSAIAATVTRLSGLPFELITLLINSLPKRLSRQWASAEAAPPTFSTGTFGSEFRNARLYSAVACQPVKRGLVVPAPAIKR